MTSKNKIIMFMAIFGISLMSGCEKFLDKKQNAAAVVPSTIKDLQALMDNAAQTTFVSPSFPEASSDEYYLSKDIYSSFREIQQSFYTWKKFVATPNSSNDWSVCYYAVYNANLALDLIQELPRTNNNGSEWDNVKGSALFFRAYHFLNLLWEYAKAYDSNTATNDKGIALRLTSNFNVPSTRATNQQSYEQVINDIKASLPLLPVYPFVLTRPSKGAAYGLLARCYLSMRDYENALNYSDSALKINDKIMDFNGDGDIVGTLEDDAPFKQFNKETIFYCEMNSEFDIFTATGFVDTAIVNLYDCDDLRKVAYLRNDGANNFYFKASYSGDPYVNFTGIATDEMYLIRAECYIREGDVEKGLNNINTILGKRYRTGAFKPLTKMSEKEALEKVLEERRKEFLFRGNRWMDIKRLNKEGANIILERNVNGNLYKLQANDNFYALPIPDDIIAITGMLQN